MKVYTSEEYLNAEFGDRLCLVSPILPVGGLFLVHAEPGAGKSAFALTLAKAVCEGSPLLGTWSDVAQDTAALVQLDMSDRMYQDRLSRHGAIPGLHIFSTDRETISIINEVERNADWIKQMRDLDLGLVIFDTLRRVHPFDEDKSDVPVAVYQALRHAAGPRACIGVLHHDNKGGLEISDQRASRGSGGWTGEIDTAMQLRTRRRRLDRLIFTKTRGAEEPEPPAVELDTDSLLVVPRQPERPVIEWMKRECRRSDAVARKDEIRAAVTDQGRWLAKGGALSQATFYRWWAKFSGEK